MSNVQQLREQLPPDFVGLKFNSWAAIRQYSTETDLGCLTVVRNDSEDLRETVVVEPDAALFAQLAQMLTEPTLRMLTIVTGADDAATVYAAMAKEHGVQFLGNAGKIMTASLASPSAGATAPEEKLAAIDPALTARVEDMQDGCVRAEILSGDRVVTSGKATVKDGIATFDGIFTEMDFQRRGLATAVMGYLVRWALAKGASAGLLNASPHGQKLYHGLGWTAVYDVVSLGGQPAVDFQERMRRKYARPN